MGLAMGRLGGVVVLALALGSSALAQVNVPAGAAVNVPSGGTMSLGCTALNVQGTFNVNAGQVTNTGDVSIASAGTVNGGQGTMSVSGSWNNSGTFVPGSGSVIFTDGCVPGPLQITGTTVFNNLTLSSSNGRTFVIPAGANITVNGTLTLQGTSGQPIQLVSSSGELAIIRLGPSAQVFQNYSNLNSKVQIGSVTGIPTLSEYGLIILALLMAGSAHWQGRRSRSKATHKN